MKYFTILFIPVFLWAILGIAQNNAAQFNIHLQTGDLLFCSSTSGELSKAIDQATQTANQTHFDHVGIVEVEKDTVWVIHASPKKGVCREFIGQFLASDKGRIVTTVYRLKTHYQKAIPAAIQKARKFIGQNYNCTYKLNESGFYCSEFVYEIFTGDSIFTLSPMTFKNPETGETLPGWISHYQKLGIPVPEGEPGCNPNGLASSRKLELIGVVKLKGMKK